MTQQAELKKTLFAKYHENKKAWTESDQYKLILEQIGVPLAQPSGFKLLIKVYGADDKLQAAKSSLVLPSSLKDKDLWNSRVGLVLAMGPEAYEPSRFPEGPWCDVGEYIYFTRHDSSLCQVNGHNLAILNDDKCLIVVNDPTKFKNDLQIGI